MVLDIVAVTLILIFFVLGFRKGLVIAIFSFLGIFLGVVCALKLSHLLADYLLKNHIITSGWVQLLSYIVMFLAVVLIVRLIAKAIDASLKLMMLGIVNRIIGGLLYAFIAAFVWSSLLWIATQMHMIEPQTIADSKTYTHLAPLAPWVCEQMGKLLPFFKNIFSDLQQYFNHVDQKIPAHVGTAR